MSGKSEREKRKAERLQAEAGAAGGERRRKLMQLAAGAAFLAIAVVVVLIVVNSSSSGGDASNLEGASEVSRTLKGIPQREMVAGDPGAKVELIEFGDLQCPFCAAFAKEILPSIIENQVKNGEATLEFRNFVILGAQSTSAGAAALAAGKQGRGWNYVELFYRNQGAENSGYADDEFLESVAKGAGVANISQWNADRAELTPEVEATTQEAQNLGFSGTPSFAIKGPKTDGLKLLGNPESASDLEQAIEEAR
jgi:protein-disulfide isomerase